MKQFSFFTFIWTLLFIAASSFHSQAQGVTIRDSLESFTIWFPDQPDHSLHLSETEFGEIEITRYQLNTLHERDPNLLYVLTCTRYPDVILSADSVELARELLENLVENALYRDGGRLIYQDYISHRAYPGIIWRIDLPNNKHTVYARAFAVNNKIFTLVVLSPKNRSSSEQADQFFGSFTVF